MLVPGVSVSSLTALQQVIYFLTGFKVCQYYLSLHGTQDLGIGSSADCCWLVLAVREIRDAGDDGAATGTNFELINSAEPSAISDFKPRIGPKSVEQLGSWLWSTEWQIFKATAPPQGFWNGLKCFQTVLKPLKDVMPKWEDWSTTKGKYNPFEYWMLVFQICLMMYSRLKLGLSPKIQRKCMFFDGKA